MLKVKAVEKKIRFSKTDEKKRARFYLTLSFCSCALQDGLEPTTP